MYTFKLNRMNITAPNRGQAEKINDLIDGEPTRRLIILYRDGSNHTIKFNTEECEIYYQSGYSIQIAGTITGGEGRKIIEAAVDGIDRSYEFAVKIKANRRRLNHLISAGDFESIIEEFEDAIPEDDKSIFDAIIMRICGNYKEKIGRMYKEVSVSVQVRPENWFNILRWFAANVLDARDTDSNFQHRKAFVTTCIKMGDKDLATQNTIEIAKEENSEDFWKNYTDKKSK